MDYNVFEKILNDQIFESSKSDLLEKIAKYPDRYIGLFRPTKPKAKILQNLLQSNEIRFGDALEILFEKYFEELGFISLEKKIGNDREYLDLDQLFKDNNNVYFIEQKVRDDHDSTKKRGQIANFEKKILALLEMYDEKKIKCFLYFVDPGLIKNKKYYTTEIEKIKSDYKVFTKIFYGKELWEDIGHPEVWDKLLLFLKRWKKEIPEMPSINFDENPTASLEEIKNIDISLFRKIFNNKEVCKEILPIIFPENKTLELLYRYFTSKIPEKSIYKTLAEKILNIIN